MNADTIGINFSGATVMAFLLVAGKKTGGTLLSKWDGQRGALEMTKCPCKEWTRKLIPCMSPVLYPVLQKKKCDY